MDFRSLTAGGVHKADQLTAQWVPLWLERFPVKFFWFLQHGYRPHVWQTAFHAATHEEVLTPFRHLVAGRRGGKTLSAAWEVLYYALHPAEFHRDAHGEENERPLWIWILAKDYKVGRPSLNTFIEVIRKADLVRGKDYDYNKTEKVFNFYDGDGETLLSTVEFRSADDPQSLRGAGLDILWIDESAFIPTIDAWDVVFPALTDKLGVVITTTTPNGKNWFYERFWSEESLEDPHQFRVEYTSIDNPYFPRRMWEYALKHYHPVMFKQEFMAAFDAMAGVSLPGDWLKYFVDGNPDIQTDDIGVPRYRDDNGELRVALDIYMAVDPAISLSNDADHFAIAIVGLSKDRTQAFLLDYWLGRIQIPDQLDKIREWYLKWRPQYIAIESVAYQAALAQLAARMDGLPPVSAIMTKTKKNDRIMQMGPLFRIGKIRIRKSHKEFIEQWVNFDHSVKNNADDLLDAVEMALTAAGVLFPIDPFAAAVDGARGSSLEEEAYLQILRNKDKKDIYDPELGSEA